MAITFDANLLTSIYQSRLGLLGGTGAGLPAVPQRRVAPTAPWTGKVELAAPIETVRQALSGRKLIDESSAKLDLPGAGADYRRLFALYQGLSTLMGVAERMQAKGLTSGDRTRITSTFAKGLTEVSTYVRQVDLDKLRLVQGDTALSVKTTTPVPKAKSEYVTPPLVSGSSANEVPAFQGNVQFNIKIKRVSSIFDVAIDLAGMGGQTRTIANVANYINQQLAAAGVDTRFESLRIPGKPRTTEVGGKTITLGPGVDQWALKVKVGGIETASFSAPATAGAVYVAQNVGDADPDGKATTNDDATVRQLLKFQTDTTAVPAPLPATDQANYVDGRIFAQTLAPEVKTVRATKVGPDGAVYMLADVTAKTAGQEIKGDQDVALLKYDAAGQLIYARTLGAASTASGLGLAIDANGQIAVAGSVTGVLGGATDGPTNSTGTNAGLSDSFVTLFDADGQELWTQRRGARLGDEASQVSFGADGTVYVAGRSQSALPNAAAIGGWDNYLEAFRADATGKIQTVFTQSFGTTGDDKPAGLVVDGTSVVTASIEGGHAILRRYDVSGAAPVLSSTRDLGDLQGGDIAGLALDGTEVVLVGSTTNAALTTAGAGGGQGQGQGGQAGSITRAHAGGTDAFAFRLNADLTGGASLAYYGGAGNDRATSLTVSGGQVWIGGSAGTDLPNHATAVGVKDGFLARLDVAAGTIAWSRRFTGKDGRAAPTAIAVDTTGASVLDRIGLPKGELELTDSTRLTALSSLRAGDTFTVRTGLGRSSIVTIEEKDTLDTLAQKIRRATGFTAKVTIGTTDGQRRLTIAPIHDRAIIEIGAGKTDRNALEALGIPEGVVRETNVIDGKSVPADGKAPLYGLSLPSDLNLRNDTEVRRAIARLATAMGVIRTAYKDLVEAASPKGPEPLKPITGAVPAYLTNQIANYQAALNRLTGGG